MAAFTPFLRLYKPGGGSTGFITPDEVVDIDRINANMDLIDTFAEGLNRKTATTGTRYGRGAAFNWRDGTEAAIDWDTPHLDSGDFTHQSGTLTCAVRGLYLVSAQATMTSGTTGQRGSLVIRKGSAALGISEVERMANAQATAAVTLVERFGVGDQIRVLVLSHAGANIPANASAQRNLVSIARIGD